MKTRKTIHEVSDTINTNQLDVTNLQFFKMFSSPIWLAVVISISLGFVTKPVRAENTGTEDVHRGYRYIKPKGVENTAGSASQGTKESSAEKNTGAKKTDPGEQAKSPNESASAATSNLSTKESSTEKCAGAEKTTSGAQDANAGGNYGSAGNVEQESKDSSTETVKESSVQAPTPGNLTTNTDQNTQQMPLTKDTNAKNSTSGDQNSQSNRKIDPVSKTAEGEKAFPIFDQADKNDDHYVTKDELKYYPSLLDVFDKVDAGKDGKLEQHEYQNLEIETKREGQIP